MRASLAIGEHLKRIGAVSYVTTPYDFAGQYPHVRIDAGKARRELGWQSRIGLEEGFRRTFGTQPSAL